MDFADLAETPISGEDLPIIKRRQWLHVCPSEYRFTEIEKIPEEIQQQVLNWNHQEGRGLLISGPTRTFKTRIAWVLLYRLFCAGASIRIFTALEFEHSCARRFRDGTGEAWIEDICKAEFVFFDDFGQEPLTDRVQSELFGVIENRCVWKRPTIITTNLISADLAKRMNPDRARALNSRFQEFFDIALTEEDGLE